MEVDEKDPEDNIVTDDGATDKVINSVVDDQLIEIKGRAGSNDESMLPVHFLPEGKQCYDWINNDIELKRNVNNISLSYLREMQSPEHKMKTKTSDSISYSSCHMDTSMGALHGAPAGIPPHADTLTVFLKAAEEGDIQTLQSILDKAPTAINFADCDGYTALHRASYSGHENVLLYLLEHGANVNARTNDGWQPIHCATRWNKLGACKILLEHKADINAATKGLQTPLHFAALNEDNSSILEMFLLNSAINVNVTNAAGDTPYDLAHRNGPQVHLFDLVHKGLEI